jgi:surface protein
MAASIITTQDLKIFLFDTILPIELSNIILNYAETTFFIESHCQKFYIKKRIFDLMDWKTIKSIHIYGVMVLVNPKKKFNRSIIETITGNVVLIGDVSNMFSSAKYFRGDVSNWDVSQVTDMNGMFYNTVNFNQNSINKWDTSNVTDMKWMFSYSNFDQNLNSWNTSKVVDMSYMFYKASNFNQDISGWDTSQVTDMSSMFANTVFDQDISGWDISQVTNMDKIFSFIENFKGGVFLDENGKCKIIYPL